MNEGEILRSPRLRQAAIITVIGSLMAWGVPLASFYILPKLFVHIPLYLSVRPLGDAYGVYFSGGVSLWRAFGDPHGSERLDHFLHHAGGEGALVATFEAGYEWRFFRQSLVVRPTADLLVGPDGIQPMVGVGLGVAL